MTHYVVDDDGQVKAATGAPDGVMRAVQSIKRRVVTRSRGEDTEREVRVELRLWDKPGPLKLAGQHVGLFKDKVQHDVTESLAELLRRGPEVRA